jgi:hypothetical protein
VTTPQASSPYITREEAARLLDGTVDHIYQGDIFLSLELFIPQPDGSFGDFLAPVMVVSHDCEYTKIRGKDDKHLLVAPLRDLSRFGDQRRQILDGKVYAVWPLPVSSPVDEEYAVDLRLLQPIALRQLEEATLWTCISPGLKEALRARVAAFLLRLEPK